MWRLIRSVGLVLALGLAVGLSAATKIAVEASDDVVFSRYRTYAWGEGKSAHRRQAQRQIVSAIEAALADDGLTRVEQSADVLVSSYVLPDRQSLADLSDPSYWDFMTGLVDVDPYDLQAGTLVIDLNDAGSGERIWRCIAAVSISGAVEKNTKKIDKLVRRMFKKYPPN
jgi:hypothetical protein